MSGRVVLCEGKRDVRLVEQFYETERTNTSVDTFLAEDVSHELVRNFERRKLENFAERRNPYDALVKSENGVENLETEFATLCHYLLKRPAYNVCYLTDLDKKDYDHLQYGSDTSKYHELLETLNERVQSIHRGRNYRIEWSAPTDKTRVQLAGEATLHSTDGPVGTFDVLAFRSDLEDSAGIDDMRADETEAERLESFLSDRDARLMSRIL